MGCSDSKDLDFGNTMSVQSLGSNKSMSKIRSADGQTLIPDGSPDKEVPSNENRANLESGEKPPSEEGKLISNDSPDQYFSSRKEEETMADVNDELAANAVTSAAEADAPSSQVVSEERSEVQNVVIVEEDGKKDAVDETISSENAEDIKEAADSVEAKPLEETIAENNNDDSVQHFGA